MKNKKFEKKIKIKEEIKDIKADTLMTFVPDTSGVYSVRTGKIYYITTSSHVSKQRINSFAKEFLVNDLLEDYEIVNIETSDE